MADYIPRVLGWQVLIGSTPVILWEPGWVRKAEISPAQQRPDEPGTGIFLPTSWQLICKPLQPSVPGSPSAQLTGGSGASSIHRAGGQGEGQGVSED